MKDVINLKSFWPFGGNKWIGMCGGKSWMKALQALPCHKLPPCLASPCVFHFLLFFPFWNYALKDITIEEGFD
jgi:hypothetical protein